MYKRQQQNRLDELTLKVNDMETLIDEVSAAAYDKAVEGVTDVVRTETRKEDMRMIEDTKKSVSYTHLDKFKLFIPKANGIGAFGEVISSPITATPGVEMCIRDRISPASAPFLPATRRSAV